MTVSTIMITNQEDGFFSDICYFSICSNGLKSRHLLSLNLLGEPVVRGRQKGGQPFALRDIAKKQQRGLEYEPNLMLIYDVDVQARWNYRFKKSFREAVKNKQPFVNPVKPTTLNWRG